MPTEAEVEEALDEIRELVPKIGDEIEAEFSDLIEEGEIREDEESGIEYLPIQGSFSVNLSSDEFLDGFVCAHGQNTYIVIGGTDSDFVRILYPFDLVTQIGSILSREQAGQLLESDEIPEVDEEELEEGQHPTYKFEAARRFLESIEEDHMRLLQFYLGDRLSSPDVGFSTQTAEREDGEGDFLFAYRVDKKIFPYDDELTVTQYNDAVQAVVSVGYDGVRYLSDALIFDLAEEETETTVSDRIDVIS